MTSTFKARAAYLGTVCAASLFTVTAASAAGLDRSGQSVSSIFNESGTVSFTFAHINPSVTGEDAFGNSYDVGRSYGQTSLGYTQSIQDGFDLSVIIDQPYGADVSYNNSPLTSALGGTGADLDSEAISVIGRYRFNERVSVFGGIKAQRVESTVDLNGQAYASAIGTAGVARGFNAGLPAGAPALSTTVLGGALQGNTDAITAIETTYGAGTTAALGAQVSGAIDGFNATDGYSFKADADTQPGWLIGAAYEIPEIAFRFVATYHAEIDHDATTTESLLGNVVESDVEFKTPQSLNLELQTGIAADTLLLASYRWTDNSEIDVVPTVLGSDLVNIDDGHRFTLGVGRRFTEQWSGSVVASFEPKGDDDLVSPLGPTNGLFGLSLGGRYVQDNMTVSGGVNYSWLGDASPEVGGQGVARFEDNHSVALGLQVNFTF
ncbi:hypothetical protein [Sulfitobacter sp. S190]|uniref:hypothetical protein n=1 Tax=Sulfitobacter sp. S190 TaxID=2867022 RepID=UPI0021A55AD5|nr:hypothetical protein [Sulfitobacter sp. S190]UWR20858.1 hypothetical protein K3756_08930 [Sulfitobacter sp. S190]